MLITRRWTGLDAEFAADTEDDIEGQTTVFRPHPRVIKRRAPPPLRFSGKRPGSELDLESPIEVSEDDATKQIKIY